MATANEVNTSELPLFSGVKPYERLAIVMKAEGKAPEVIANQINAEFDLDYKPSTVREWFWADGRLLQAYLEYNEKCADLAVEQAKSKIKKLSADAADTLEELMKNSYEGGVRVRAALGILNKYVPDRQVILDGGKEAGLPAQLGDAMDAAAQGEEPTDKPAEEQPNANDAPDGPPAS